MNAGTDPIRPMTPLDADPARSFTLPGWAYTDPAVFEREKEAIFFRSWHYAGALENLARAGDYVTARILDQSVIVIRGKDGELRGFYNVCQHRAHELLQGRGNAKVITCPYHAWSYRADGRLRTARGTENVDGFDASAFCLKPVKVEEFAGKFVFYNLDLDAAGLNEQAGDLAVELRGEIVAFDRIRYAFEHGGPIRSNWKVAVDNYLECYHCGPAHPAFADLVDMKSYRTRTDRIWSSQKGGLGRPDNKAYPVGPDDPEREALFWWLWPTTTFNVLPGSPGMSVFNFLPDAVDRCITVGERFYLPGRNAPADEARVTYVREVLGPEDVSLCESVQRGLASQGYGQGRFIVEENGGEVSEHAVHHFHRLVAAALEL
jgi:choline monooxygenase